MHLTHTYIHTYTYLFTTNIDIPNLLIFTVLMFSLQSHILFLSLFFVLRYVGFSLTFVTQGVLAAVLSGVLGNKDPDQVNTMAKQAGEVIPHPHTFI